MTLRNKVRVALTANRAAMLPPWTVADLARAMGVPRTTLASALRRGLGKPGGVHLTDAPVVVRGAETAPPAVTVGALADALGVGVDKLTEQLSPDNEPGRMRRWDSRSE